MKLSVTTLGCPDWDMETIISNAVEYGFDGIDFRGYKGEMNIYELPEFTTNIEETKKKFADAKLEISCFSSSVHLTSKEKFERNMNEIKEYSRLCNEFGAQYIRVFGGSIGDMERSEAVAVAREHLEEMQVIAKSHHVKIVLETHDDWTRCEDVRLVLEHADKEAVAVLWDVHHPYRTVNENPEKTWETLGEWIEYTHWKDSYVREEHENGFQYCLTGKGDIPLEEIYHIFEKNKYDGWYTLEWEKKWHPEIEEPEVAFPQYVQYMRSLTKQEV